MKKTTKKKTTTKAKAARGARAAALPKHDFIEASAKLLEQTLREHRDSGN